MATYRNDRSGATLTSDLSMEEAFRRFRLAHPEDNHWLCFWLQKYAQDWQPTHEDGSPNNTSSAIQFLCDSFVLAIGRGLKRPMLRCHFRDQRFKIYLSGKGTLCVKTGMLAAPAEDGSRDPVGDEVYMGCLLRGRFMAARNDYTQQERELSETEQAFFADLEADPVGFMAQCSKDMSRCCYCNLPLEDANSKRVGYGPVCATRWGLPWGDEKHTEGAPSFAKLYGPEASLLVQAIRANPADETPWLVFGDWLEERGLPRVQKPKGKVTMPRNDSGGNGVVGRKIEVTPPAVNATEPAHQHGNDCCSATVAPVGEAAAVEEATNAVWTYSFATQTYTADASDLKQFDGHAACPKCHQPAKQCWTKAGERMDYDEVVAQKFAGRCGAKIEVAND